MSLAATVSEKANLIWAIADKLTGAFKPHQYGEVILPLTVIRRFDCVLEPTKPAVLAAFREHEGTPLLAAKLRTATGGLEFYNTSAFTFARLLDDPAGLAANFRAYCDAFSPNVRQILEKFKPFRPHLATMAEKNILYMVLKEFTTSKADLHPDKVSNLEMGYIFEELIRRFSEAHNEDAGQHYTPREVIELMVNLVFAPDGAAPSGGSTTTIYDPACGTGGMLSVAEEHIHKRAPRAGLVLCGQEINDETFAVCQADMLIKGNEADFIKNGNTLSDDQFPGQTFDYVLSNPPFGREWKNEKAAVEAAAARSGGRFSAGLPSISDSQMLFLQTALAHLKPQGRAAIIQNGSPLFTGDAGSGPSEIRRHILENDYLDAIIALPNDIFYNTGIATYIWLLCKSKPAARRGKVQLINAAGLYEKRRKSLGNKRNDIPQSAIDEICRLYMDFAEGPRSKIFDVADFGYTRITIERPADPAAPESDAGAAPAAAADADAPKKRGRKPGKRKADAARRDTENVPLKEDIEDYFAREVLPFAPDAWIDHSKSKIGYEIPFTRYFYEYTPPRPAAELAVEIHDLELRLADSLAALFEEER